MREESYVPFTKLLCAMNSVDIAEEIERIELLLMDPDNRRGAILTREWSKSYPTLPGIYAWFEGRKPIYIGESGNISARLDDSRRTANHTLRRSIGLLQFGERVNRNKNFSPEVEEKVDASMRALKVSVVSVNFGRTETEEHLVNKYRPVHNKALRRQ